MSAPASDAQTPDPLDVRAPDPTDVLDTGAAGGLAIRGSALRAAGYVAGALLTLASAPLLFRHLGVVDFGRYVTVLSLLGVVGGVTEAGLGAVAVREYSARAGADRDAVMRSVLGAKVALTVLGLAGALAFALVAGYDSDLVLGTAVGGLGLLVGVVQGTYVVPLAAGLRLGWITGGDLLRAALSVGLVVALVVAGAGLVPFLAIPVLTGAVLLVLSVLLVRGLIPLLPSAHPRDWWRLIRETTSLAVATALMTLYFRLVIVLMSLIALEVETGLFATSYRITEVLAGFLVMLVATTFPVLSRAARDDLDRLGYALQRIFEIALIGGVWVALATVLGAEIAVRFIGGEEALPAADVLRIQALALIPIFLNATWQHGLLALHRHRELLVANGIALATVLVLALALVPGLQAEGAAIAVVAAEAVLMVVSAIALARTGGVLPTEWRVVPCVLAAAALAAVAATVPDLPDAVGVGVASLVFFAVLAALRAIPTEVASAFGSRGTGP